MPNKCSAPDCRSNYDGEPYTPVFKLSQNNDMAQESMVLATMVLALKCQIISPACYQFLQTQEYLILPHHNTLRRRLYTSIGLEEEFISYLQVSTKEFNSLERNVVLHMDEIHIKSDFSYTGGKIIGSSVNTELTPATTVLAYMVSSLCKKWSTIVRLLPCSRTSASELFPITKQIISGIENCDLQVQVLCIDNYPLNFRLFKMLLSLGYLRTNHLTLCSILST